MVRLCYGVPQVQKTRRLTMHMTADDLCWSAMGMLNYWVGRGKLLGAYEVSAAGHPNASYRPYIYIYIYILYIYFLLIPFIIFAHLSLSPSHS